MQLSVIVNNKYIAVTHFVYVRYFLYPSGASCYHRTQRPPTCVLIWPQSAWAEHILFSNYLPTARCSPHHDQFTKTTEFEQYISNAYSLLSTVLLILGSVLFWVQWLCTFAHRISVKTTDCGSGGGGGVDFNMINNVSKCALKGSATHYCHQAPTYTRGRTRCVSKFPPVNVPVASDTEMMSWKLIFLFHSHRRAVSEWTLVWWTHSSWYEQQKCNY